MNLPRLSRLSTYRCTDTGRKCDGYARVEQASSGRILDLAVSYLEIISVRTERR